MAIREARRPTKAYARSFRCECGASLMLSFQMEEASSDDGVFFACPRCKVRTLLANVLPGHRVLPGTLKVDWSL